MAWTKLSKAVNTWTGTMAIIPAEPTDGYGLDEWGNGTWGSPTSTMATWTTILKPTASWITIPRA